MRKQLSSTMPRVLILGIGNILWADEGFGVRTVEAFHQAYSVPDNVTILDGGTQGLYLVQFVAETHYLIVFDAIDYGLAAGTLKIIENDEVPKFTGAKKMSLHQTGFQEVLSAADLLGRYPAKLALIGCQPVELENWGGPLTEPVKAVIPEAIRKAVTVLKRWGIDVRVRSGGTVPSLLGNDLDFDHYERRAEPAAFDHLRRTP
ncbi:hydrogenase expression/formation protein HupD [Mesorhizobium amorphae]|uniref:HyaD/HybD family hydrogenase maturation endopeptidase n=1 Tax=Mesorhizobium amorphae TaxID=71433 RepID=UPI00235BF060|nr:HyaD/HybD family hydrogenase maturation endopeptidase [Mesorhizobium amorphae]GLR46133.1 hydrogenase expression/formation protein HupD [Mesorhizobium amorphae]